MVPDSLAPTPITHVLLDLDGVMRHFDVDHRADVEAHYDLPAGILAEVAFSPELLQPLVTGQTTRATWTKQIGSAVGSIEAATAWLSDRGRVDVAMVAEVDKLRNAGRVVSMLTNGADTIPTELLALGLVDHFDNIFNSADIGYAKPSREVFQYVCGHLAVAPEAIFFTDDSPSNLSGAIELGMTARTFMGIEVFRAHLHEFGISRAETA